MDASKIKQNYRNGIAEVGAGGSESERTKSPPDRRRNREPERVSEGEMREKTIAVSKSERERKPRVNLL